MEAGSFPRADPERRDPSGDHQTRSPVRQGPLSQEKTGNVPGGGLEALGPESLTVCTQGAGRLVTLEGLMQKKEEQTP